MHIGVTTLYNYNYGSALQCFALQDYIEEHFCICELLCERTSTNKVVSMMRAATELGILCLKNSMYAKDICKHFLSQRSSSLTIQPDSQVEIHRFVRNNIRKRILSWKELCELGNDPEYAAFIAGSDQVWNGSRVNGYNMYFLRFAPTNKRVAYSPSFGGEAVAKYNQKTFKEYISEFEHLSAREQSGSFLIKELSGRDAPVLADPVCLLTAEKWRTCIEKNIIFPEEKKIQDDRFILAFFLNKPSDEAVQGLRQLQLESGCPVYSFGYRYDVLADLTDYHHLDGSPWEFLRAVDTAHVVVTDSFHATVFAALFHSPFYVYERNYTHGQNQSVRITNLLSDINMLERFQCLAPKSESEFLAEKIDQHFSLLRRKSHEYLVSALGVPERAALEEKEGIELFQDKRFCCGCGACAEVCPKGAIEMRLDEDGSAYPIICEEKCVHCRACLKVCALKRGVRPGFPAKQQAYVGYGIDDTLTEKSSSGGIFAVMAKSVLERDGVVYGAAMCCDEGGLQVRHICAENLAQLQRIQGSKYVQSCTEGIFSDVRQKLESGKMVLFSGTSCQIAALKAFLKKDYEMLYTIDLVCHGVPGQGFLQAHTEFLKKKYGMKLRDLSFRRKDTNTPYVVTAIFVDHHGKEHERQIKLRNSAYFRLFMGCEGYRESCYSCPFASTKKPADITLGDYEPNEKEIERLGAQKSGRYHSFVMANSEKGITLLEENCDCIHKVAISLAKAVSSHPNLRNASLPGNPVAHEIYLRKGFEGVERYIRHRNAVVFLPSLLKKILHRG